MSTPPSRTIVVRSWYRWDRDIGGRFPWHAWLIVHLVAWALCIIWLLAELSEGRANPMVVGIVLWSCNWLWVGPALMIMWQERLRRLVLSLQADTAVDDATWARVDALSTKIRRFTPVVVGAPVVVMAIAYLWGGDFFVDELGLPASGPIFVLALVVLMLGSATAGWGIVGAFVTVLLALALSRHRGGFAPYAGTTSLASRSLGGFCFSTATIFGAGGVVLLPGLCAAAWSADGAGRVALIGPIVTIVFATGALLAVPAVFLSRQGEDNRIAYLDDLSRQIEEWASVAADPDSTFGDAEYVRLRALLEMRSHVVGHTVEQSSLELVKRIPVVVVFPMLSIGAAWLSLIAS